MRRTLAVYKNGYSGVLREVRGRGLFIGMVFESGAIGYKVAAGPFKRRVLTSGTLNNAQAIRIEPALTIPYPLLDEMLNRLEDTLKEIAG